MKPKYSLVGIHSWCNKIKCHGKLLRFGCNSPHLNRFHCSLIMLALRNAIEKRHKMNAYVQFCFSGAYSPNFHIKASVRISIIPENVDDRKCSAMSCRRYDLLTGNQRIHELLHFVLWILYMIHHKVSHLRSLIPSLLEGFLSNSGISVLYFIE